MYEYSLLKTVMYNQQNSGIALPVAWGAAITGLTFFGWKLHKYHKSISEITKLIKYAPLEEQKKYIRNLGDTDREFKQYLKNVSTHDLQRFFTPPYRAAQTSLYPELFNMAKQVDVLYEKIKLWKAPKNESEENSINEMIKLLNEKDRGTVVLRCLGDLRVQVARKFASQDERTKLTTVKTSVNVKHFMLRQPKTWTIQMNCDANALPISKGTTTTWRDGVSQYIHGESQGCLVAKTTLIDTMYRLLKCRFNALEKYAEESQAQSYTNTQTKAFIVNGILQIWNENQVNDLLNTLLRNDKDVRVLSVLNANVISNDFFSPEPDSYTKRHNIVCSFGVPRKMFNLDSIPFNMLVNVFLSANYECAFLCALASPGSSRKRLLLTNVVEGIFEVPNGLCEEIVQKLCQKYARFPLSVVFNMGPFRWR
jgi:hypothetical protein